MKIKELTDKLQKLDGELNVYISGYEGGINDMTDIREDVAVALNCNSAWHYGAHEEITDVIKHESSDKARGILLYNEQ